MFLVRARCRRKEHSRSLSHLLISFLLFSVHNRHGGAMAVDVRARSLARAVDLPAKSFHLARPGVAPPLLLHLINTEQHQVFANPQTVPTNLRAMSPPVHCYKLHSPSL